MFTASYNAENQLEEIEFNDTAVDRKIEYIYASNNPVMFTDPNGEFAIFGAILGGGIELEIQLYVTATGLTMAAGCT